MDQTITHWINGFARLNSVFDTVMIAASEAGVQLLVFLVAVQWWSGKERSHVRHSCVAAGLSFIIGLGFNQVILLFVQRVRPYDAGLSQLIVPPSADWSFPSDHATASMAIAAAFLIHKLPLRATAFGLLALIICWSRIFVGTHYVTDILGGALTGLAAAVLVKLAYREGTRVDRLITGIL